MSEYRDLLTLIVEREKAVLPEGYDSWGIKSVSLDRRTYGDYKWPVEGNVAACDPERISADNTGACPDQWGDGLCVATTWAGMGSGGISARLILLVAYRSGDVLGRDDRVGKLRTTEVAVVAQVDGERLLREEGHYANLRYAYLCDANLHDANLSGANLRDANLRGANLSDANLSDAAASQYTIWPDGFRPTEKGIVP